MFSLHMKAYVIASYYDPHAGRALLQCYTRLRLLHLLYDIVVMWRKTIKYALSVLYSDKTWVFNQSERALGPIYIINIRKRA